MNLDARIKKAMAAGLADPGETYSPAIRAAIEWMVTHGLPERAQKVRQPFFIVPPVSQHGTTVKSRKEGV